MIEAVAERRTRLSRPAVGATSKEHLIAANVDQVLVVVAAKEPPIRFAFIDRVLVAAERGGMKPAICLNKTDLDAGGAAVESVRVYERIGYPLFPVSAEARSGLVSLREFLQGRITVLAGHSGVGKSSILTAIQPNLHLRTGDLSEKTGKGRHTTTSASLLPLDFGGWVVDTPGIRAFGLAGVEPAGLAHHYPEMRPHIDRCRYRGCTHTHEPECAVKAALEKGLVSAVRYESYRKIVESISAGLEGEERRTAE